ncbi:MAG: hypothetical protein HKL80_11110 [Acidimicrobiales bacterium]|nr:hypothetical protein [Acidimicrobiales bacterium]
MTSEETSIDLMLGEIKTPEQLRAILDQVDDEGMMSVIKMTGVSSVLDRIFEAMTERFSPDHAQGTTASIQWNILAEEESFPYHVDIADGKCTAAAGDATGARIALALKLPDFLRLVAGQLNPVAAFTGGKLSVTGDLTFAMSIQSMFVI